MLFVVITMAAFTFPSDNDTFNGSKIVKVEQDKFPNAVIYSDSLGSQVLQVKLMATHEGILLPENATPLEGFILIPTQSRNLTRQNIQDIFKFIDYLDLSNRMRTDQ